MANKCIVTEETTCDGRDANVKVKTKCILQEWNKQMYQQQNSSFYFLMAKCIITINMQLLTTFVILKAEIAGCIFYKFKQQLQ